MDFMRGSRSLDGYQNRMDRLHRISVSHVCRLFADHRRSLALEVGAVAEPMEKWGINVIIALIGIIVDITGRHDYLAMVYPLRAMILCLVVVVLIARWEQKSKVEPSQVR
jgi:uncharacterized membrane protein YkvI